jgi:hypothetical protein
MTHDWIDCACSACAEQRAAISLYPARNSHAIRVDREVVARLAADRQPDERNYNGAIIRALARAKDSRR